MRSVHDVLHQQELNSLPFQSFYIKSLWTRMWVWIRSRSFGKSETGSRCPKLKEKNMFCNEKKLIKRYNTFLLLHQLSHPAFQRELGMSSIGSFFCRLFLPNLNPLTPMNPDLFRIRNATLCKSMQNFYIWKCEKAVEQTWVQEYQCLQCEEAFDREDDLVQHMQLVHPEPVAPTVPAKRWVSLVPTLGMCPLMPLHQNLSDFLGEEMTCT